MGDLKAVLIYHVSQAWIQWSLHWTAVENGMNIHFMAAFWPYQNYRLVHSRIPFSPYWNSGSKQMKWRNSKPPLHPGADNERNHKNLRLVRCFRFLGFGSFSLAENMELSKVAVWSAWLLHWILSYVCGHFLYFGAVSHSTLCKLVFLPLRTLFGYEPRFSNLNGPQLDRRQVTFRAVDELKMPFASYVGASQEVPIVHETRWCIQVTSTEQPAKVARRSRSKPFNPQSSQTPSWACFNSPLRKKFPGFGQAETGTAGGLYLRIIPSCYLNSNM